MRCFDYIPRKDILGEEIKVGDSVVVFSHHGISYDNCIIVEKPYVEDSDDIRRALLVDENMWIFGLGNHELLKIKCPDKEVYNMRILTEYKELEGKTIAFTHMAQFAQQITIATTDRSILMATMKLNYDTEEKEIRVYREGHVIKELKNNEWLRVELSKLGLFDLEAYEKEMEAEYEAQRKKYKIEQEKREREELARLKAKYEEKKRS